MSDPETHPLEAILRYCAEAAPQPWYPSDHSRKTGVNRDSLDPHLNRLRLGGLIQLTDWVKDYGQGYALTPSGKELLESPRKLAQLQAGVLPVRPHGPAGTEAPARSGMTTWDRGEQVRAAVYVRAAPTVMYVLLAANIAVFLVGVWLNERIVPIWPTEARRSILHGTGGVFGTDIVANQWWRLLTTCFVHAGLVHLAVNMYALYQAGGLAERLWGRPRFLALYLIAGWGGSCVALASTPGGVVGASTALCGLFAAEAVFVLLNRQHLDPGLVSRWLRNLLVNAALIALIGWYVPNVSNAGHLGGAGVGAVLAVLLSLERFGSTWQRWLGVAGVLGVPILCWMFLARAMTVDPRWQELVRAEETRELDKLFSEAKHAEKVALTAHSDAKRLHLQDAAARNAAEVRATTEALGRGQHETADAANALRTAGPFRTAALERRRQALQEYMTALSNLCETAAICLQKAADCTKADRDAWDQQEKQLHQAGERWSAIED